MRTAASGRRGWRCWSEAEARAALEAQSDSGLSVAAFARELGICPNRLHRWRARLGGRAQVEGGLSLAFMPVRVVGGALGDATLEVVTEAGHRVRVPVGFDAATLVRLVRALEEAAAC